MTYQQTLDWMFLQLPMYQKKGRQALKKDLRNILNLSKQLGNPQEYYPTIHVGGTNGKGSTSHLLASVLQEAGYKTGLYTSPHLLDFRERIKVNGEKVSKHFVINFITEHRHFLSENQLSFFEMTAGMAFMYFKIQKVDIAIIEVGLGGRLDSTNIIHPVLSVITNISFDHMNILGNTLPLIAIEKAGIIKNHTPVIIGERHEETERVFIEKAKKEESEIIFAEDVFPSHTFVSGLNGTYQRKNICTALSALKKLSDDFLITPQAIEKGLKNVIKNTGLAGRWQILSQHPLIICDTAHNEAGIRAVVKQLNSIHKNQLHLILGFVNDKEVEKILPLFPKEALYYFTEPDIPRKMSITVLKKQAGSLRAKYFKTITQAFVSAKRDSNEQDVLFAGGSMFVVAEILKKNICKK